MRNFFMIGGPQYWTDQSRRLASLALTPQTQRRYASLQLEFKTFCRRELQQRPRLTVEQVACFLAFLHKSKNYAPRTLRVAVSALSHQAQQMGKPNFANSFRIQQILRGAENERPTTDKRAPLTIKQLRQMLVFWQRAYPVPQSKMLNAMATLAFFGLLRLGEITQNVRNSASSHVLLASDLKLTSTRVELIIRQGKHQRGGRPHRIVLKKGMVPTKVCPVQCMQEYFSVRCRPQRNEPLFVLNSKAVTLKYFTSALYAFCRHAKAKNIQGHSYRIGGASWYAEKGFSDSFIRRLGRWKSNAFLSYIRHTA